MSLMKKIRKYLTPNKATLDHSVKSVGQNINSGIGHVKDSIAKPSGAMGKRILGTVGGVVGASLGDPRAGGNIRGALKGNTRSTAAGRLSRKFKTYGSA